MMQTEEQIALVSAAVIVGGLLLLKGSVKLAVVALGSAGVGVWFGVRTTKNGVQEGVVGAFDSLLGKIGISPDASRYGRVAHNLVDMGVGGVLGNRTTDGAGN